MTLNEYQEKAKVTDCRDKSIKMICNGFGLIGELEELNEVPLQDYKGAIKESGDVLWYCSSIATYLNLKLEDIYKMNSTGSDINRPIAEVFKKVYRDKDGEFDEKDKEEIAIFISYVINWELPNGEKNLKEVMQTNIDKLYSRKERGVIKGNGNDR